MRAHTGTIVVAQRSAWIRRGRWPAGDRVAAVALRGTVATSAMAGIGGIVAGLVASWVATYLLGGAQRVVPHFYYVPILFAAVRFGPVAALATALISGVMAGPLTPLDVTLGTVQETHRWLTRAVFFATIGVGMAALVRPSLPSVVDEVRDLRNARAVREALARNELFLRYQPIVNMLTGGLYGVEALVRWNHPQDGERAPGAFLDAAEASGAIRDIDAFVFAEACRQAAEWKTVAQAHDRPAPCVTVNMSAADLEAPDLIEQVRDTIEATRVDPGQICIEVTESILVDDFDLSAARLAGLKTLGVKLSIDDFGSGYSSLNWVHRFPTDVLKVDRTFLETVGKHSDADGIVGAIVLLARSLDVGLIAEGVETVEQRDRLVDFGYETVQGFFYAKPMLAAEITPLIGSDQPFQPTALDSTPDHHSHH